MRRFVEECRRRQVILPGSSVLERLCADALVAAERRIETRIAAGLDDAMRRRLDRLLTEEVDGGVSRFVWLRRFEVGPNSADIDGLLDRLEFLQGFDLPSDLLETVPPHRIARLRRQGERYFTDGLRDISARLYAKFRGSNGCHHVGMPPLMAGVGGFFTIRCQR